jgi:hypothetical protein
MGGAAATITGGGAAALATRCGLCGRKAIAAGRAKSPECSTRSKSSGSDFPQPGLFQSNKIRFGDKSGLPDPLAAITPRRTS